MKPVGERLAMERAGRGRPMVLIHGLGSDRHIWGPVMPALSARHEVFALDVPGFGDSPPLPDKREPTVPALADAVERELDSLGVRRPHLVGNSMGGWISLELARRGVARSVVALSPAGAHTISEGRRENLSLATTRLGARVVAPLGRLPFLLPPLKALGLRQMFAKPGNVSPEAAAAATRSYARSPSLGATRRWMSSHNPEGLDEISCPVLIAWGTEDRLLTKRQAPRWVAEIPGSKLRLLPGLGHAPQYDDPELVSSMILEFAAGS
jgi:pimeloyl-ACP methyl ester carboxylesterase